MTKRMLHENITTSDKFTKISFEAECLYCRLLTQTDDYGNVRGSVGYVKDVCFPRGKQKKIDYQMVGKWLAECQQVGLLLLYIVDDIEYLHFDRFEDFQTLRKDRIKNSSIPTYTKLRSNGCQLVNQMVADCPHELELEVEVKEEVEVEYVEIINYLNSVCGTFYKHTSKNTIQLIKARIKEGFTVNDFKIVIDKKFNEWNNTEHSKYLRPETLFGNKMEGYLNQQITKGGKNERIAGINRNEFASYFTE